MRFKLKNMKRMERNLFCWKKNWGTFLKTHINLSGQSTGLKNDLGLILNSGIHHRKKVGLSKNKEMGKN